MSEPRDPNEPKDVNEAHQANVKAGAGHEATVIALDAAVRKAKGRGGKAKKKPASDSPPPRPSPNTVYVAETIDGAPQSLVVPRGYYVRPTGTGRVSYAEDEASGVLIPTEAAPFANAPILITAAMKDLTDQSERFRLSWLKRARWQHLTVPREQAFSNSDLRGLAKYGFPVGDFNKASITRYLYDFEHANEGRLPRARSTTKMGWVGAGGELGFMWGRTHLTPDGEQRRLEATDDGFAAWPDDAVVFTGRDTGDEQLADALTEAGDFDTWLAIVKDAALHPRARLGLYAAFVPPLLSILGAPNFVIDWSNDTSTGKSTILRLAASVWGRAGANASEGSSPLIPTWETTFVAVERRLENLSGMPVILDDTKLARDPERFVSKVIYEVVNSSGRARGTLKGSDRTASWRTVLLSTGEHPATAWAQHDGARARILCIRGMPFGDEGEASRKLVDRINDGVGQHYGFAGPMFVQWLLSKRDQWGRFRAMYEDARARLQPLASSGPAGRFIDARAALEVAGRLAHMAVPFPFGYEDPLEPLWEDLARELQTVASHLRALDRVWSWAQANPHAFRGRGRRDRETGEEVEPAKGWIGKWAEGWVMPAFDCEALDDFIRKLGHADPNAILRRWRDEGWLETGKDRNRLRKKVRVGTGTKDLTWMVALTPKAMAAIEAIAGSYGDA